MTMCFATLPFGFEGRQRMDNARHAIPALREAADSMVLIPNDRLFESASDAVIADTFARADQALGSGIYALWQMMSKPGYIKLDFPTLQRAASTARGVATLAVGSGDGKRRAEDAANTLLESPMLERGRILSVARSVLVSIVGGPDLTLKDVGVVMDAITARAPKDAEILMGTALDEGWTGRLAVTAVVCLPSGYLAGDSGAAADRPAGQAARPDAARPSRPPKAARETQTTLMLDIGGKGRFKDTEPTVMDGEDMDIPTFIRRGIPIEK